MLRRGAYLMAWLVALGVYRTVDLVSWGAERTSGLAIKAGGTFVRLWDVVGVEQAVTVVAVLPETGWETVRSYIGRLEFVARCRARYRSIARPLGTRYRELRKSR
jgi:hypothetical protein